HDEAVRCLPAAGLEPHGRLAPRRLRLAADGSLALAAAVRVIPRRHGRPAHCWPKAQPARAPGLAKAQGCMLRVAHLAERGHAASVNGAHLARGEANLGAVTVLTHELRTHPGPSYQLTAAPGFQLDIVDL